MTQSAAVVVVGAGMVGASVAYHLADLGQTDILVVDKGPIPHNHGSTSHAPGGVVAMSHDRLLARMSFYSTALYRRLGRFDDSRHTYNPVGSIEVARTRERWADLVREHGEAIAFGAPTELLDARGVSGLVPYLDPSAMVGGLHIPDSAIVAGSHVTGALLRDAVATGRVLVRDNTPIRNVDATARPFVVVTDDGRIEADEVVLCTNIWQPSVTGASVPLPLRAFQHQYIETTDVLDGFELTNPDHEVTVPTVRDMDEALYFRHHWNRIGVGSYQHAPLAVHPREVGDTADLPFLEDHFGPAWETAQLLIPALGASGEFTRTLNGMFAFTVDGMPLLGETTTPGLWMAVGSWITHAGGVGKAVAELMTAGESEWDLRQAAVDRFHSHATTESYVSVVTNKNYREIYDVKHPSEPPSSPRDVRLSPFAPSLQPLDPHNVPFGGIELAAWYGANQVIVDRYADRLPERSDWASRHWSPIAGAEHLATRDNAGLFDLTGLSIIEVRGADAAGYVDYLCSNRMDVPVGKVVYTTWLTPSAGIKRDLAVARLDEHRYWMFVGEGTRPQDVAWAQRYALGFDVALVDVSDSFTALGLWGPSAPAILRDVARDPGLGYFRGGWIEIGPVPVYAMRISYVGEAGYELHIPIDQAPVLFDRLWKAGAAHGLVMAGSKGMDSMRIEKGYRLWGADIHTEHNPFEAGLGWTVKLDKGDFVGAEACRELAGREPSRRLTCLTLDAGDPLGNEPILGQDGSAIGYVTSAAYGHSVGAAVAYGYLPTQQTLPGTALTVLVEGQDRRAIVADDPIWDPAAARL